MTGASGCLRRRATPAHLLRFPKESGIITWSESIPVTEISLPGIFRHEPPKRFATKGVALDPVDWEFIWIFPIPSGVWARSLFGNATAISLRCMKELPARTDIRL